MRNTNIISQKEYDNGRVEYVNIIKESVIPKGNDVIIDEVWNIYTSQQFPDLKLNGKNGKTTNRSISDDENKKNDLKEVCKDSIRNNSRKLCRNNVSLKLWNIKDIKNIDEFLVENITEIIYSY